MQTETMRALRCVLATRPKAAPLLSLVPKRCFHATPPARINPLMVLGLRYGPMLAARYLRSSWWNKLSKSDQQKALRRIQGKHPRRRLAGAVVLGTASVGCYLAYHATQAPITGRWRLSLADPDEIREMSQKGAHEIIADYKKKGQLLPSDHEAHQ